MSKDQKSSPWIRQGDEVWGRAPTVSRPTAASENCQEHASKGMFVVWIFTEELFHLYLGSIFSTSVLLPLLRSCQSNHGSWTKSEIKGKERKQLELVLNTIMSTDVFLRQDISHSSMSSDQHHLPTLQDQFHQLLLQRVLYHSHYCCNFNVLILFKFSTIHY